MTREFDIVLFGATGFVGRLTAEHLAMHAPSGTRIALSGRDIARLETVRASLADAAATWPLIELDATDEQAVATLAARTKVVCTTVGPYARLGLPLVQACARAGTHYCDLTGEVLFVRESIDACHEEARRTGARIVHSCGFDSVPSDLGVHLTAQAARLAGDGTLGETILHVRSMKGGVSGGTVDSMREQVLAMRSDSTARSLVLDPYALSPDRDAEPRRNRPQPPVETSRLASITAGVGRLAGRSPVRRDGDTGRWIAPFIMASYNTRVVRRSNALTGWSYGRGFRYDEVLDTGTSPTAAASGIAMTGALAGLAGGLAFAPTRKLLDRVLPAPGTGPSEESMRSGRFAMEVRSTAGNGARYCTTVSAPYDPGYTGTAVMLGQSALSLACDDLSSEGGVLTPATALGDALVERLRTAGFTLNCVRTG